MASYWQQNRVDLVDAVFDVDTAGTIVFAVGQPMDIKRLIMVTTEALTVADTTITVGVRDADGSNSEDLGSFVIPFTGSALNDVQHVLVGTPTTESVGEDGSVVNAGLPSLIKVNPGQELFFTSDGGSTAGQVALFVQYEEQGWTGARVEDAVELDFVPA